MQKTDLSLVVLAAGIGARYGGLKQMDPMGPGGENILDYSVYDALAAGFTKVVFVISEAIEEAFRDRVGRHIEKRVDTDYVFQRIEDVPAGFELPSGRKKPWGTAHATLASRTAVDGPFVVINADDFYGRTAYQAGAGYLWERQAAGETCSYCMIGYRLGNTLTEHGTVARAICTVDEEGFLASARELTKIAKDGSAARYTEDGEHWSPLPGDTIVSMNCWGFTPAIYDDLAERFPRFLAENQHNLEKAEFYIPNVTADLIRDGLGRVKVIPTQEKWHGVTYPEDKPQVQAALRELVAAGVYPPSLWSA